MGHYAFHQVISREFRDDIPDYDAILSAQYLDKVRALGYTPAGQPVLTWHEISEQEAEGILGYSAVPVRAGDWRVRGLVEVAENDEIPEPRPVTTLDTVLS